MSKKWQERKRNGFATWICIHVSSKIEEAAKDADDITVKRQKETIKKLAREVAACDSIAKAQQEMMQQQKDEINHLKKHMKNMVSKMKEMEERHCHPWRPRKLFQTIDGGP